MAEQTPEQLAAIEADLREAAEKRRVAGLPIDTRGRRKGEHKHKMRVNQALLNGRTGRTERWTILCRPDRRRAVEALAKDLSQPGAKISVALLMEHAIDLLIAHYTDHNDQEPQA